jgi:hypothetical protein
MSKKISGKNFKVISRLKALASVVESFNRTDDSSLGKTSTGALWTNIRGSWGIASNKATSSTAASGTPLAVLGFSKEDMTLTAKGIGPGVGTAFWVTDSDNWWATVVDGVESCQTCSSGGNCNSMGNYACGGGNCASYGGCCSGYNPTNYYTVCNSTNPTNYYTYCSSSNPANYYTVCNSYSGGGYYSACGGYNPVTYSSSCSGYNPSFYGKGYYSPGNCASYSTSSSGGNCSGYYPGYIAPSCSGYGYASSPGNCASYAYGASGGSCSGYGFAASGGNCASYYTCCTSANPTNYCYGCVGSYNPTNYYSCNCVTDNKVKVIKSVAGTISTVANFAISGTVQAIKTVLSGNTVTVSAYSDTSATTQIGSSQNADATGATKAKKHGIIKTAATYSAAQTSDIDQFEVS